MSVLQVIAIGAGVWISLSVLSAVAWASLMRQHRREEHEQLRREALLRALERRDIPKWEAEFEEAW